MNGKDQTQRSQLLTIDEVAKRLNKSPKSVRRMIKNSHFRVLKVVGSIRILESSVNEYIDRAIDLFLLENGEG